MRRPASKEITSDSVELCDAEVCFYKSNLLERLFDFRKYIRFHLKKILNLQGFQQNLRLEAIPIDNAASYYQQGNIVCRHSCVEFKRSNERNVGHKLWSML